MEISGQYLTYEEYKGLGGTLDIMPFNLLEFEIRKKIDNKTFNRLVDNVNIPQEVKLCEFNMINRVESYTKSIENIGNASSESIDGYSVSYLTPNQISDIIKSKEVEFNDIIRTYLLGIEYNGEYLLYCGAK